MFRTIQKSKSSSKEVSEFVFNEELVGVRTGSSFISVPTALFIDWTGVRPEEIKDICVSIRELKEIVMFLKEKEEKISLKDRRVFNNDTKVGEIMRELSNGKSLVLSSIINENGEEIADEELYINSEGLFEHWRITCYCSADYDLGKCKCGNHISSESECIRPETALKYIKRYIEKMNNVQQRKNHEESIMLWLGQWKFHN